MSSRDNILNAVKAAQPESIPLPGELPLKVAGEGDVATFKKVLETIGGRVEFISGIGDALPVIQRLFPEAKRIVSSSTSIEQYLYKEDKNVRHHTLHDVDVVIMEAPLGVAENSAVWVTEEDAKIRVLPFIGEHLVVIIPASSIVPTMHHAYEVIGENGYGFGVFIAGPSKTADIEQSLVLGAHGPKSMTVLIINDSDYLPSP